MRILLIALSLASCSDFSRYQVGEGEADSRKDAALVLEGLGWDIELATNSRVLTEWHRLRLRHSPLYVVEVQMRITVDRRRQDVRGYCIERVIREDGINEQWRFRACKDKRALAMVKAAMAALE